MNNKYPTCLPFYPSDLKGIFNQLLIHTEVGIIMINSSCEISFANSNAVSFLGYDHDDMAGKPVELFISKTDTPDYRALIQVFQTGGEGEFQVNFIEKERGSVTANVSVISSYDENHAFQGVFLMIENHSGDLAIQEKNQAGNRIFIGHDPAKMSEELLIRQRVLLELSKKESDDLNVAFSSITEQVSLLLGTSRTSIWRYNNDKTALICEDLYTPETRSHENGLVIFVDDYPEYLKSLEQARVLAITDALADSRSIELADNYLIPNFIQSMLDTPIRSEGKMSGILCCEQTGKKRFWTIEDQEFTSSIADIISTLIQTHQRHKVENALQQSEEKYRKIVDNAVIGIYKSNLSGQVLFINQAMADMFEYEDIADAMQTGVELLYKSPDYRKAFITHLLKDKVVRNYEIELMTRKGNSRFTLINAFYEEDQILGMIMDITQRKKNEEEIRIARIKAEESDRLKTSLMANMSHEFRTPMNAILGFSDLIANESQDPDLVFYARKIHASGNRLMATLKAILDLADLEAQRAKIRVQEINVQKTVQTVLKPLFTVASEKGLYLITEFKDNILAKADRNLLELTLNNLIDNAIKFTNQGGVTIETGCLSEEMQDWVVVRIKDTGIGIAPDQFEVIFYEFRQLSEGYSRSFEGSGLGLTLARKMTEMIDGKITVESEPGLGSIFTLWLPASGKSTEETIYPAPSIPQIMEERNFTLHPPDSLPLLLIVEDNDDNAEIVKLYLKGKYLTERATDGFSAIKMAGNKQYDGILMDINLGPGMDGLKAAREIRKQDSYMSTPIIAITGYTMAGDREKLLQGGCTHYIGKPFSQQGLTELINGIFINKIQITSF
jgi:PAS domain S-box-containing protein